MPTVSSFEELRVWQDARKLTKQVYDVAKLRPVARDRRFREQLQAAAVSTMSNIAEGFERGSRREFIHFLNIAKGSNGEVRSLFYAALDQDYLEQATFGCLRQEACALSRRLGAFIKYLESYRGRSRARPPE